MNLKQLCIDHNKTGIEAAQRIDLNGRNFVLVTQSKKVIGLITDGDLRRYILEGNSLENNVKSIMNRDFVYVNENDDVSNSNIQLSSKKFIPVLDHDHYLKRIIFADQDSDKQAFMEDPVLILAGGFGKRLRPITDNVPKPMIKVSGSPLLEIVLKRFVKFGFKKFYISTHYLSEQIIEYFKDGSSLGINIDYLYEDEPLGTAGSISLIKNIDNIDNLVVSNSDIITELNFYSLLEQHKEKKSDITIASINHSYTVPFGVLDANKNSNVQSIIEKPTYNFNVSGGVYVLNKKILNDISKDIKYLDMPDLINSALTSKKQIDLYHFYGQWIDVGRHDDLNIIKSLLGSSDIHG